MVGGRQRRCSRNLAAYLDERLLLSASPRSSALAEVVAQLGALGDDVSAIPVGRDEAGVTEHREVLGDRARGHLEGPCEIGAGLRCLERVEDRCARGSDQSLQRVGRGFAGRLPRGCGAARG